MATKAAATKTASGKSAKVKPIPDGYHAVTPYLIVDGAARALDFYKRAFDAKELMRIPSPGDKIGHAEIKIGDSVIMLADEHPEMDARSPGHFGGSPISLMIYVEDVDKQFKQALAAGGTELRPLEDKFYGDRSGTLKDPFGHSWHLSTHKEDVSMEEMNRRMAALKKD
jgi:PhnB protein